MRSVVVPRSCFVVSVVLALLLLTSTDTQAQPRVERDRSIEEGAREGRLLMERGEYLRAVDLLNGLVDSASPGVDLSTPLFLLTEANPEVDRNYPALESARRFLLLYPDDKRASEVRYIRGVTAWREGSRDEARRSFTEILEQGDNRQGEALYWLARMYGEENNLDSAEYYSDRSLALEPHGFTDDALYLSAWIKEGRGEYVTAAEFYRRLVEEFPESDLILDAQLRLGVNQARNGYHESAITLFTSLSPRSDRQQEELLFYSGESHAALGRHERAIEIYNDFLRSFPNSSRARSVRYGLGWSQLQAGKYDQAVTTFRMLKDGTDSLAAAALYQIGAINITRGDTASALASLHELVARLPYESFSDNAYNQIGRIHYRRADYDSARRYLMITARQFPESDVRVEAFHLLGESYAALKEYDNAQYSFSRVVKLGNPDNPLVQRALYREGIMLYTIGRFTSAIDRLRRYIGDYPEGADIDAATFWIAEALYLDRSFDEAEQFYTVVINKKPVSEFRPLAMYGLGWSHFRQRNFREAAEAFEAYIDAYPNDENVADATIRLADSYRFLKQYDRAIKTYESIGSRIGAGAQAEEVRVRLAEALAEMGEPLRATEIYRELIRRYPKSERIDDYAFAVGATWFNAGNDTLAISELEKFLESYERSEYRPNAQFILGDAYYNLGDYETSLNWYLALLEESPNSPIVPEAIEGLRFALEAMDRGPEAINYIEAFAKKNPDRLAADSLALKKGMIYFDNEQYGSADTLFRKLIADYPQSPLIPEAWYQIGKGAQYTGAYAEAIATYRRIVDDYPTSNAAVSALIDMAELQLFQKNYAGARQSFLLFVERYPESDRYTQGLYGAGRSSLLGADTMAAVGYLRQVIDSVETSENDLYLDRSRILLADVLWRQGKADEGLDLLASVVSRRRDYTAAEALLLRSRVLVSVNDLAGALAELRRLTDEFVDYTEFYESGLLELGKLYETLSSNDDAIATYQTLLEVSENPTLRKEGEDRLAKLQKRSGGR